MILFKYCFIYCITVTMKYYITIKNDTMKILSIEIKFRLQYIANSTDTYDADIFNTYNVNY